MASGIYEIVNTTDGKRYVGSAVNLAKREIVHFSTLRKNCHSNAHLQHAWNKYGEGAFEFRVVQECATANCIALEQKHIDYYDFDDLYNLSPTAGSLLGMKHTEAAKAKISAAQMGKQYSLGKQNFLGYTHTNRARARLSSARMGKKYKKPRIGLGLQAQLL